MQVLKFGGSSVANSQNINKVIAIVKSALKSDKTIVVSSAISGATDLLIKIAQCAKSQNNNYISLIDDLEDRHNEIIDELICLNDNTLIDENRQIKEKCAVYFNELREICKGVYLLKELSDLTLDSIVSFGELLSTNIISAKLRSLNVSHQWKDSRELIKTELVGGKNSVITSQTNSNIQEYFSQSNSKLFILPGFIASDAQGRTTTLGRGGSDYTASIYAVGVDARVLEIWTDVCGMMTADPRIVPNAQPIRNISYKEALELSHFGAKVVYPPTIQPVVKQRIPIYVKNTFQPDDFGTLIENNPPVGENKLKGISSSNKIALLSMEGAGMVGIPGYTSRLFDSLTQNNVNIILITQASSVHTMCIAIDESDAERAKKGADETFAYEISLGRVDPLKVEKGYSIISLVGDDMKNQAGASGKMFDALGREGINIRAIAQGSSEKNVSAVVQTEDVNYAIKAIHTEFFESKIQKVNLFIAGYGTIGKALISIIKSKREYLINKLGKDLVICGISNSKNFIADKSGIDISKLDESGILELLKNGNSSTEDTFAECAISYKLNNTVFVDCTASKIISNCYPTLFENNISVVTCNKIANSAPYEAYKNLFKALVNSEASYKYETTVCAALPVLATINQLNNCGDNIFKIEGILSGTLNYLFSKYNGEVSFASIVKDAQDKGFTEPDPRLDLSGGDVFRKFLILSREAGEQIEADYVDFTGFIPDEIMGTQNDNFKEYSSEFYSKLEAYETTLKELYTKAAERGNKLRFIATLDKMNSLGRKAYRKIDPKLEADRAQTVAKIELTEIEPTHPFYNLEGTDNSVIIQSQYYPQGIVIKGAGAGPFQTAGGVLNDILND